MRIKIFICLLLLGTGLFSQSKVNLVVQKGHTSEIINLAVSDDDLLLCSISADLEVIVWDLRSSNVIAVSKLPYKIPFFSIKTELSVEFAKDNTVITIGVHELKQNYEYSIVANAWSSNSVTNPKRNKKVYSTNDSSEKIVLNKHELNKYSNKEKSFKRTCQYFEKEFTSVAVDKNKKLIIAGCSDNKVYVYDFHSGKRLKLLAEHTGSVNDVVFSKSGNYFFTASSDRSIAMWDTENFMVKKRLFKRLATKTALTIDEREEMLFIGSEFGEFYRMKIGNASYSADYWKLHNAGITTIQAFNRSTVFFGTNDGWVINKNLDKDTTYYRKKVKAQLTGEAAKEVFLGKYIYHLMTIGGYDRVPMQSITNSAIIEGGNIVVDYKAMPSPFKIRIDTVAYDNGYQIIVDSLGNQFNWKNGVKKKKMEHPFLQKPAKKDLDKVAKFTDDKNYLQNVLDLHTDIIPFKTKDVIASICRDGLVYLWKKKEGNLLAKILFDKENRIVFLPDNYYMSSNKSMSAVGFRMGTSYLSPEQFDLKFNRPDIVLKRLGSTDENLINAYHSAYLKRLKKMNFTEKMLSDEIHLPELTIGNLKNIPTTVNDNKINLDVNMLDTKYNLDRINVWINDVAIYGTKGIDLREEKVQSQKMSIPLNLAKGKNKIEISVLNQAGAESYKETIFVECTAGKEKPDLYIISIGVSEFKDKDFNLKFAAKDAADIINTFKENKIYQNVYSKLVVNNQVTRENIVQLKDFLKSADINDQVILFFAGHGVLDEKLDYFLASYDMDFTKPSGKGIAYEEIENLLDGIAPLKKIILLDACHSGEIDKDEVVITQVKALKAENISFRSAGTIIKEKDNALGSKSTAEFTKSLFADLRKGTGSTVISSASGVEFAMESSEWQNGLFTYCLLSGIKSKNADLNDDNKIMLSELQDYVSKTVLEKSMGKQQPSARIENNSLNCRIW